MFLKQIAIGHAGDIIADCPMQSLRLHSLRGRLAKLAWIDNVAFENLSQHLARAPVHFRDARVIINILIQKFPERPVRFEQFVAVANERRRLLAHIIRAWRK